jgi:xylitol oxidase
MSPLANTPTGSSWSGTVQYGPGKLYAPTNLEELELLVALRPKLRALGTRHSFSTIAAASPRTCA